MIAIVLAIMGFMYSFVLLMLIGACVIGAAICCIGGVIGLIAACFSSTPKPPRAASPLRCDIYGQLIALDGLPIEPASRADLLRRKLESAAVIHLDRDGPDPSVARFN